MTDLIIVALLVFGFIVGYFRGALRQLVALGVWLVAFLLAAHARPLAGGWLGTQWTQYSQPYVEMLAFAIVFVIVFTVGVLAAEIPGSRVTLTRHEWLDDIAGGLLGAGLVMLTVAAVIVILESTYATGLPTVGIDVPEFTDLHSALLDSTVMRDLLDSLISGLGAILGPLLPPDVRAVMG